MIFDWIKSVFRFNKTLKELSTDKRDIAQVRKGFALLGCDTSHLSDVELCNILFQLTEAIHKSMITNKQFTLNCDRAFHD